MKVIADILTSKYGRQYTEACREEAVQSISEKLKHKMGVQSPSKLLVEKYLIEIAKNYNVEYEPDPQVMADGQDAILIDMGGNGSDLPNNLDLASGGAPQPLGFIGFPQPPMLPDVTNNINLTVIIGFSLHSSYTIFCNSENYIKKPAKMEKNFKKL